MRGLKVAFASGLAGIAIVVGCDGGPKVIAQVGLRSTLGTGPMAPQSMCMLTTDVRLTIGDPTDQIIRDNDAYIGGSVKFTCSVIPEGTGFKVTGRAELLGVTDTKRGTFNISGVVFPKAMQPKSANINMSLTTQGETFTSSTCTVSFEGLDKSGNVCAMGSRDPGDNTVICTANPNMDVAAGKIWASVVCETGLNNQANPPRTCKTAVTFRFENCLQAAM